MEDILSKAAQEALLTLLTLVATVLIPYGTMLLREWVKAKVKRIKDSNLREGIEFAYDRLDSTATTVVAEIEQTIRRKVEGQFGDTRELLYLAEKATLERLPPDALRTFVDNFGDERTKRIITGKIESKVAKLNCVGC